MQTSSAKNFTFFKFDCNLFEAKHYQNYMAKLKILEPKYVLTRSGKVWQVRFPAIMGGELTTLCLSTFMRSSLFNTNGKKRKRFTLGDWLQMVRDLQKCWGDFPLHVRVGYEGNGNYITEEIQDEDELIIHLKYMDDAR